MRMKMEDSPLSIGGMGLVCVNTRREDCARYEKDAQGVTGELSELFPGISLRRLSLSARIALLAAAQALLSARQFPADPSLGIAMAIPYSNPQNTLDFIDSMISHSPKLSSPTAFSHSVTNIEASLLSMQLGIHGICTTVSQFGLSFAGAFMCAQADLLANRTRAMLLGTVEAEDSRLKEVFFRGGKEEISGTFAFFMLLERKSRGRLCRMEWHSGSKEESRMLPSCVRLLEAFLTGKETCLSFSDPRSPSYATLRIFPKEPVHVSSCPV